MLKENVEIVEIYPKVLVYRNVFNDHVENYNILKESADNKDDRIFSKWSQWSKFGEYLNPTIPSLGGEFSVENLKKLETSSEIQEKQKFFLIELLETFYDVTKDYIDKYGHEFNFNLEEIAIDEDGNPTPRWQMYGPSICKYHKDIEDEMSMIYHSDFIREPIVSPGYKFALTANVYFNDDYDGGEIDFCIGKDLIKYKPQAGDWLLFPSGHPGIMTKDGEVYLHGVFPSHNNPKYFSRMYWRRYSEASAEWKENEQKFGKKEWLDMQDEIMENYRKMIPQRSYIEEGVRIS